LFAICFASRIVPEIDNTLCKTFIPFRGYGSGPADCMMTLASRHLGISSHEEREII